MDARRIPFLLLALDALICAVAAIAGGRRPNYYFIEGQVITWVNALQILAICAFAVAVYRARALRNERAAAMFWLLVAAGSLYLAADEVYEFHENAGAFLHESRFPRPPLLNGFGDLILLAYGLAALVICAIWRRELLSDRPALLFLALGGALLMGSEVIDFFGVHQGRERFWWSVSEESLKLLGFCAILGGVMLRWIADRRRAPPLTELPPVVA